MPDEITIDITPPEQYTVELLSGYGVPIIVAGDGEGGAAGDYLSYTTAQNLSLTQLRMARRNLFRGSAPAITYNGDALVSSVTYSDGSTKTMEYTDGRLTRIDHVYPDVPRTYRQDVSYNGDNRVSSIAEVLL